MNEERICKIIHVDMDAFYASVEQRDDPTLSRVSQSQLAIRPDAALLPRRAMRRVAFGVRSAMPSIVAARKGAAELVFVPPKVRTFTAKCPNRFKRYSRTTPH